MFKKNMKVALFTFVISTILAANAPMVLAAVASGDYSYFVVNGYAYKNQASVSNSSSAGAYAFLSIGSQSGGNIPSGYMGAYPCLIYSSGTLAATNGVWTYNSNSTPSLSVSTQNVKKNDTYFSLGYTATFNGSGYTEQNPNRSPNLNWP